MENVVLMVLPTGADGQVLGNLLKLVAEQPALPEAAFPPLQGEGFLVSLKVFLGTDLKSKAPSERADMKGI